MTLKTILQGFGAAMLVLLLRVWPLLSSRHSAFYHSFLPMQSVVWGNLIDVTVLSLLLATLFLFLQKGDGGVRTFLWALVFAELVPVVVSDVLAVRQMSFPRLYIELLFWGAFLAALALRSMQPLLYKRCVHGFLVLLLLAGCGLAWVVPELLYFGLRAQPHDVKVPVTLAGLPAIGDHPLAGGRIVWLLFDELSYNQAFDHRFPGLSMPAFDSLKSESISFSDLRPAGYNTERVIPSFFLGHVIENLVSNLDGEPRVTLAGQKGWHAFNANETLFADARRLGWTTGVVGWYNPYCRILAGTLDYCYWRMGDGLWTGTSPDQSTLENAAAPLKEVLRNWQRKTGFPAQEKHGSDLQALLPQAEALIRDQSIGFVFIHLSVPHPPGIYDRRPGKHRVTGTYIDNLALADHTLSQLMATLNATPLANKTAVIVCSDHSWRVPLWRPTPQWSKEEEIASQGRFDQRPVLMIHYPGQQSERDVNAPFEVIRIHEIIERMLRGQPALP
jgi:Sulfatase